MDQKTIQAIEAILKRGNDAEVRKKGNGSKSKLTLPAGIGKIESSTGGPKRYRSMQGKITSEIQKEIDLLDTALIGTAG